MSIPKKMRSGFSWDEAIFLAKLSKEVYQLYQQKQDLEGTELKELYHLLYPKEDWDLVHSISSNNTSNRGLILKHHGCHQYIVTFRGIVLTSNDNPLQQINSATDLQWELVQYSDRTSSKICVVKEFLSAYQSVSDQIHFFFKTLTGQLEQADFEHLKHLNSEQRLVCVGAIADAGAVRLGASFGQQVRESIFQGLRRQDLTNNRLDTNEPTSTRRLEQSLIDLSSVSDRLEIYITGHSLGGSLANLCALSLKQILSNANLGIKVYTFGAPKVGNQFLADFYNRELGGGFSYRVENTLDTSIYIPFSLPSPFNVFMSNGIQAGEFYFGNYAAVGEAHSIIGLGAQGISLNSGGAFELFGGIPFPHGFDVYIQLLEQQQQLWRELLRPIRSVMGDLVGQLLQEQKTEIAEDFQQQIQSIQASLDELRNNIYVAQNLDQDTTGTIDYQQVLDRALPQLEPDLMAKIVPKIKLLSYSPGTTIIRQGDRAHRFFVIAQGQVEVSVKNANGLSRMLRELGVGEYFGEIGLLSGGLRTATVRATTADSVKVLVLDQDTFRQMISDSEVTATQLAYRLATRVVAIEQTHLDFGTSS